MIRRMLVLVIALLFSVSVSVTAAAGPQDGERGRGGGFGGGFGGGQGGAGGGFGGGFGGSGSSRARLLGLSAVHEELSLSTSQTSDVEAALQHYQEQMESLTGNFTFDPQQFQNRLQETGEQWNQANEAIEKSLDEILTTEQRERLGELQLQSEGAAALLHSDVAEKLALTQAQQEKIQAIQQAARPDFRAMFQPMQRRQSPRAQRQREEQRRKQAEKIESASFAVLTADQQETWQTMQGPAFEFPKGWSARSGGGFGGGGRSGPGGSGFGGGGGFGGQGDGATKKDEKRG